MRILSFDTSTNACHIALLEDRCIVWARTFEKANSNRQEIASTLMPAIDTSFKEAKWLPQNLSLIIVGTGPGSFTSIRQSAITGRTLAQALGIPIIGITALETAANKLNLPAAVILSAGNSYCFVSAYTKEDTNPVSSIVEPCYANLHELETKLSGILRWYADDLAQAQLAIQGKMCEVIPKVENIAVDQAELVLDRLSLWGFFPETANKSELSDKFHWSHVLPLYLRNPSVQPPTKSQR